MTKQNSDTRLYIDGRATTYTASNALLLSTLPEHGRQATIAAAVALVYQAYMAGQTEDFAGQLAELREQYDTTNAGIINFALAYRAGNAGEPAKEQG